MAHLDWWGESRKLVGATARQLLASAVATRVDSVGHAADKWNKFRLSSAGLARLAAQYDVVPVHKEVTPAVEATSSDFHRGVLRGLFYADGSVNGTQLKGVRVRLRHSHLY